MTGQVIALLIVKDSFLHQEKDTKDVDWSIILVRNNVYQVRKIQDNVTV